VSQNWYQLTGIAAVLGAGHSFLILKEHHLGFYKKHFAAT
jgi:hypothetical protein